MSDKSSIPESPRETHEPSKALSENERLRQFVEGVVEVCAWGRDAWVPIDDGGSVQDWGEKLGLLVPVAHQQPCTDEGCECDGATELLQFAWKVAPRNPESVVLESPAAPVSLGAAPQTLKDSNAIRKLLREATLAAYNYGFAWATGTAGNATQWQKNQIEAAKSKADAALDRVAAQIMAALASPESPAVSQSEGTERAHGA